MKKRGNRATRQRKDVGWERRRTRYRTRLEAVARDNRGRLLIPCVMDCANPVDLDLADQKYVNPPISYNAGNTE